uniref:Uncharacterized protein n=1 Tax=Neogobius melanostomus TaxID=47308 RepID=A0A8C6SJZ0_9GOBI
MFYIVPVFYIVPMFILYPCLYCTCFVSSVRLRSVCLGPSDLVFVPCPALDQSERFSLSLFQNHTRLATWTNQSARGLAPGPTPAVTLTNRSSGLGFALTVSNRSGFGPFVCEAQSKYPPPARTRILLYKCSSVPAGRECDLPVARGPDVVPVSLVWAVSVACLSGYSLVCSALCVALWIKVCVSFTAPLLPYRGR